jgi:ABC-2 type transport system ATP-binding protein
MPIGSGTSRPTRRTGADPNPAVDRQCGTGNRTIDPPSSTIVVAAPGGHAGHMSVTPLLEAVGLSKRYGRQLVVDNVSFTVRPGRVTGFLGANGAGKSTTMRLLLGLDRPTSGHATFGGRPYAALNRPLTTVGALLEARAVHPGRSARDHLRALARTQRLPEIRVDEVLDLVGLRSVAHRRAGTYSLGMGQRLGVAGALLGDPRILILDEPVNGLDPEGILWIRKLLRDFAREGRSVLVSSHLMSEMAVTADHLVVLGSGRVLANCPLAEFVSGHDSLEDAFMAATASTLAYQGTQR